jgi:hypothetical protein
MMRTAGVLLAISMLALNTEGGQFKSASYYSAGQVPYQLVATKLTNSGNLDLAVANFATGQIFVLLGNGDGTFQKPLKFSAPAPVALVPGDFNEDGNEDLAVVEYGGTGESQIAIYLGDGRGGFKMSAGYESGVETTGVAVADFNGDGHANLAVANNEGSVKIFLGTGKGTLKKPTSYKVGGKPYGVAAGDLRGNGLSDLAVAEVGAGSVAVLLNDGKGKFGKTVSYSAGGGEVSDVKIADLRNDGREDLVVTNGSQGMVVLLNKGDGTFGKPTIYRPCGNNCQGPEACVTADFNFDGKLDVACATQLDDSYFFYGNGKGGFGAAIPIVDTIKNQGGFSIAAGDFNNDGAPDLAIPIELKGKVAIMLNTR